MISDEVAARVRERFRVERSQLVLSASHTHCGPAVRKNLAVLYDFSDEDRRRVDAYGAVLVDRLVEVVGSALEDLAPASLSVGHGSAGFAVNRREPTPEGVKIGVNPAGPVDHDVPVLKVAAEGRLAPRRALRLRLPQHDARAATSTGSAATTPATPRRELEKAHPGATALFVMLCGGDQNPNPRGTLDLAVQHGRTLAAEVARVLGTNLAAGATPDPHCPRVGPARLRSPHARGVRGGGEEPGQVPPAPGAADAGRVRRGPARPPDAVPGAGHPAWRGPHAPGSRPASRWSTTPCALKRELPGENLIVAGYCHDVMCYIPSRRVLREGGYEAVDNMIYYGQPGPFTESVEDEIVAAVRRVAQAIGVKAR